MMTLVSDRVQWFLNLIHNGVQFQLRLMKATLTRFLQKTRQLYSKRAKMTKMVKEFLSDEDFSDSDDEVAAVINALKQRGLLNSLKLKIDSQQHKCGRKPFSLEIRKSVEFLA